MTSDSKTNGKNGDRVNSDLRCNTRKADIHPMMEVYFSPSPLGWFDQTTWLQRDTLPLKP